MAYGITDAIPFVTAARTAGAAIMDALKDYDSLGVQHKDDESPVTQADHRANAIVLRSLARLTPEIPVLSEEMTLEQQQEIMKHRMYWCVDPLDGTRTAIGYARGRTEHTGFGVLIGLVRDGVPVFGVAHYPAQQGVGVSYFTNANGSVAYKQVGDGVPDLIRSKQRLGGVLRVAVGHSGNVLNQLCGQELDQFPQVGAGRMLRVAEGDAHAAYMGGSKAQSCGFWDVAACHAIVRASGGDVVTLGDFDACQRADALKQAQPLRYDGRHFAAHLGAGKPYLPPSMAASKETLRDLGMPSRSERIER